MESDITQSATLIKLWAWAEKNKKQLAWGLAVLAVVGLIVALWVTHQNQKQDDANAALSKLSSREMAPNTVPVTGPDLLKVASDYPGTDAAQRALLMGAGDLFADGKYDQAQAQFQKFLQDYATSPFVGEAALGVAACYEAEGKTNDAASAYQNVVDHYGNEPFVDGPAKLALARLQEAQGKFKDARTTFEELARMYPGSVGSEAAARLQEINAAHPELQPTNKPASVTAPAINLKRP